MLKKLRSVLSETYANRQKRTFQRLEILELIYYHFRGVTGTFKFVVLQSLRVFMIYLNPVGPGVTYPEHTLGQSYRSWVSEAFLFVQLSHFSESEHNWISPDILLGHTH